MTDTPKVWLITGAGRGLGVDIAEAALAAGHAVVATARNTGSIAEALGEHDDLLAVELDVTDPSQPRTPSRQRWSGSAGSTYWSTTPAASRPGSSRRWPGGLPFADRDHPLRAGQRHPRRPPADARPALRPGHDDLLHGGHRLGRRLPDRLRRLEVRRRRLHGRPGLRDRAFRHQDHAGRAGVLPYRAAQPTVHPVRRAIDRRLRRPHRRDGRAWQSMDGKQGGDPAKLAEALVELAALTNRRCGSLPAPTPSRHSRARPRHCSTRPTPTATCPPASPTTTPSVASPSEGLLRVWVTLIWVDASRDRAHVGAIVPLRNAGLAGGFAVETSHQPSPRPTDPSTRTDPKSVAMRYPPPQ